MTQSASGISSFLTLPLLENRLYKMGITSEWKAFAALSVRYLGMEKKYIPLYSSSRKWERKADKIMGYIQNSGNLGHNWDTSYYKKHSYLVRKMISLGRSTEVTICHLGIFPLNAIKVWWNRLRIGLKTIWRDSMHSE